MSATLPSILAKIVARRRERYGVTGEGPLVFSLNEGFPLLSSSQLKAKTFIEGKDEGLDRRSGAGSELRVGSPAVTPPQVGAEEARTSAELSPRTDRRRVIAEVKLGSPRLGSLVGRVDPERQATLYRERGAVALSVVVEPDFFFGSWDLLRRCKAASGLPAVAKDFVVSERQLDEAADAGADVILLIAALYSPAELRSWAAAARARSLVPLVETHAAEEIDVLSSEGESWEMVGINNRDLRTFDVDLERSIALRPSLPPGAIAVAESGIRSRADVDRLASAGFDAFLVGESLLLADDPAAKLEELVG